MPKIASWSLLCFPYHFNCLLFSQQILNFGEPFFLVIREGETLAEIKVRIQKKLQVPDEEFPKVCFTSQILCEHVFTDLH